MCGCIHVLVCEYRVRINSERIKSHHLSERTMEWKEYGWPPQPYRGPDEMDVQMLIFLSWFFFVRNLWYKYMPFGVKINMYITVYDICLSCTKVNTSELHCRHRFTAPLVWICMYVVCRHHTWLNGRLGEWVNGWMGERMNGWMVENGHIMFCISARVSVSEYCESTHISEWLYKYE